MILLLAASLAILLSGLLPELPSAAELQLLLLLLLALLFLLLILYRRVNAGVRQLLLAALGACGGICWACYYGAALLERQLAPELVGSTLRITGEVVGLPEYDAGRVRFMFAVDAVQAHWPESTLDSVSNSKPDSTSDLKTTSISDLKITSISDLKIDSLSASKSDLKPDLIPVPQRLRLTWYDAAFLPKEAKLVAENKWSAVSVLPDPPLLLSPGQRWQLSVRLKPVRGSVNPGGFDYQRWLLSRGVWATGYVREKESNQLLAVSAATSVDGVRAHMRDAVERALSPSVARGLILALLIGDKSQIEPATWEVLRQTGTSHLLAISGLHIGLAAAVGALLLGGVARCLSVLWPTRIFFPYWAALGGLTAAVIYALLAGLSLPTQRAVIMVAVALCYVVAGRRAGRWQGLVFAFAACLVLDPLAGFDAGFWLSFGAVASLLLVFSFAGQRSGWQSFVAAQWAVFVFLLIPLLLHGLPIAPAGMLVNVFAIPYVGFFVVPVLLLNGLLSLTGYDSTLLWQLGALLLDGLLLGFELASQAAAIVGAQAQMLPGELPLLLLLSLLLLCVILLLPAWPYRGVAAIALLALLFPSSRQAAVFEMTVLDVGQGLAVVIRTGEQVLLYDTGPSWGGYQFGRAPNSATDSATDGSLRQVAAEESEANAGQMMVLPFLYYKGIRRLDKVIVSHADTDHQGGAVAVAATMPVGEWLMGDLQRLPQSLSTTQAISGCHGRQWQWGEVAFRILPWPQALVDGAATDARVRSNNQSCVLIIAVNGEYLVLPGDIEADFERLYLAELPNSLAVIMPHHGSKTSSSFGFLDKVRPVYAIASSGYLNRYHHPHPTIVERYQKQGAILLNTAEQGAITLRLRADHRWQVELARQSPRRYWY